MDPFPGGKKRIAGLAAALWLALSAPALALPRDPAELSYRLNSFTRLYRVQPGDTLGAIARRNGVEADLVAAMNFLDPGTELEAGGYLVLPFEPEQTYRVKRGDTLWAIARRLRVDLRELIDRNGIQNPDRLQVGELLAIPVTPGAPAPVRVALASREPGRLGWPLWGEITSGYGWRGGEFHHGLDIAGESETVIRAAASGKVSFAGWKNGIYGRTVMIEHGDLTTLYAHNSANLVREGQWVEKGQAIARVGSTGRTTGPHLHFEVYRGGGTVDPRRYLEP